MRNSIEEAGPPLARHRSEAVKTANAPAKYPAAAPPFCLLGLQVEVCAHGWCGCGLAEGWESEELLGCCEQGVVVVQGGRLGSGSGAGADHEGCDVAADVGGVGGAVVGLAAFAFVPGDEQGDGAGLVGIELRIAETLFASQLSPWATVPSCMSSITFGVMNENAGSVPAARSEASWS